MTELEWVEKYHHEIGGIILDAFRQGAQEPKLQHRFQAGIMDRVDNLLSQAFRELTPPVKSDQVPLPVKAEEPRKETQQRPANPAKQTERIL